MTPDLRILSLGAGVQSSTLALMIEKGEIPMVDAAIFADTMGEPKAVYDWLNWLETQLSYPVYRVSQGNLKQDMLEVVDDKPKFLSVPLYIKNIQTGKKSLLRRQCTREYKIHPINQKVRNLLGLAKGERRKKGTKVEMLMGISTDEIVRMKPNRIKYISNVYPLVDKGMSRSNCKGWMENHKYPKPPRSACTFCPYHTNEEWKTIKENKQEWDEVVELDEAIRNRTKNKVDQFFLHKTCVPLNKIDFNKDTKSKQLDLFTEKCDGICAL